MNITIEKPEFNKKDNLYISKILFRDSNNPIKMNSCLLHVLSSEKTENGYLICAEFTKDESMLYDFIFQLEKKVLKETVKNSNDWLGHELSSKEVLKLFISNIEIPEKINRYPILKFTITNSNIDSIKESMEEDNMMSADLIFHSINFNTDSFYIPIYCHEFRIK